MAQDLDTTFSLNDLITADPEVMGGRRVFRHTRIPVEVLFENLADGMSLDEILDQYETLDRKDVVRVLELTLGALAGRRAECPHAFTDPAVSPAT